MKRKGHKFNAVRTACNAGHSHPSMKEARRCDELHLLQRAGEISNLEYEPIFHFVINGEKMMMRNGQPAKYRPDFQYFENGKAVAEDVKGMVTADFRLRSALFRHCFPKIELRVI